MTKRARRTFTAEFKKQMVQLYQNGKRKTDIIREYELTPSALDKWISQANNSGSFIISFSTAHFKKEAIYHR